MENISKDIIVGELGSGKTTLIREKIIPTIKNFVVFDFCDEYRLHVKDYNTVRYFNGLTGWPLKEAVIKSIAELNDDTTIIIDNAQLLYFPKAKYSFIPDRGFEWLIESLKNRKHILVFQNMKQFVGNGITGYYNLMFMENFKLVPIKNNY